MQYNIILLQITNEKYNNMEIYSLTIKIGPLTFLP